MKSLYRKVDSFDGQTVTINGKPCYELGSFLGGGAAGVVYEGVDVSETSQFRPVAIKILNPVGFRLAPAATLRRCVVARRGQQVGGGMGVGGSSSGGASETNGSGGIGGAPSETSCPSSSLGSGSVGVGSTSAATGFSNIGGGAGRTGGTGTGRAYKLGPEHVWWLVSPNTKQVLAAYVDPRYGSLVELPLPKCIEIWGLNPRMDSSSSPPASRSAAPSSACQSPNANSAFDHDCWSDDTLAGGFDADAAIGLSGGAERDSSSSAAAGGAARGAFEVQVDGMGVSIPWLPPKYVQWLSQRRKVKREISNMGRVGGHRNVVELLSVLELLQDSKSTLFLILELVTGGELLDHIRLAGEEGNRVAGFRAKAASALRAEGAAQRYFSQLLSGLAYCHRRGVCHRDLSPSNLLLAESPQGDAPPELKLADFGLSACCGSFSPSGNENDNGVSKVEGRGAPRRVRSVVGSPFYMAPEVSTGNAKGYDGFKADAWSCGVVLYTMLTQSLPFGRDVSRCPRYKRFKNWAEKHRIDFSEHACAFPRTSPPSSSSSLPSGSGGASSEPPLTPTSSSSSPPTPIQNHRQQQGAPSERERIHPPPSPPIPPLWLFPPMIPVEARALLVSLLVPDPARRLSVEQALMHPWLAAWRDTESTGSTLAARGVAGSNYAASASSSSSSSSMAVLKDGSGGSGGGGGGGAAASGRGGPTSSTAVADGFATGGRVEQQQQSCLQQHHKQQRGDNGSGSGSGSGSNGGGGCGGGSSRVGAVGAFPGMMVDRDPRGRNQDADGDETEEQQGGNNNDGNSRAGTAAGAAARNKAPLQAEWFGNRGDDWGGRVSTANARPEWASAVPSTTSFP